MKKGFVSQDATLSDQAKIGFFANVLDYAAVNDRAGVEDASTVAEYAQLNGICRLADHSMVRGHANLRDAWVMGVSLVEGDVVLDGRIFPTDTHITGDVRLFSGAMEIEIADIHMWRDIP